MLECPRGNESCEVVLKLTGVIRMPKRKRNDVKNKPDPSKEFEPEDRLVEYLKFFKMTDFVHAFVFHKVCFNKTK